MSMLAAPRRKQKVINLRAKNNAWSNDSNKFGQRMLEKMGWSSGKGLGAKENGMVDHVVARFKNDEKGLGYEDKNDQWTKHDDDFNALLANLSNGDVKEEKLHSGISLENKSKKSKARVHYHKFTRGKDLTKYSEKDLANIFGKKSLKTEEKITEVEKDAETKEKKFTDKGSMDDYFKSKLAALKTNKNISLLNNNTNDVNEMDYTFKGFSGTTDDTENQNHETDTLSLYGFQQAKINSDNEISPYREVVDESKKRKKKKKERCEENQLDTCLENDNANSQIVEIKNIEEEQPKKQKKKKSKTEQLLPNAEIDSINSNVQINSSEIDIPSQKSKKLKKKKYAEARIQEESYSLSQTSDVPEIAENQDTNDVPRKKKKRKNKNLSD